METQRSIVLQKKMILFLSLAIFIIFSTLCVSEKRKNREEVYLKNIAKLENFDIITVKLPDDENEILRKNIKFFAVRTMSEDVEEAEKVQDYSGNLSGEAILYQEGLVPNNEESIGMEGESVVSKNVLGNNASNGDTNNTKNQEETISFEQDDLKNENVNTKNAIVAEQNKTESSEKEVNSKTNDTKLVRYRDLAEDNPPEEYIKSIEVSATAYCLCKKCCGKTPDNPNYGCTNSGIKIVPGTGMKVIAVDPKVIPMNSKVYVEGLNGAWDYGHAVAADTGSAIKDAKIDLYMDTHKEALEWGRRKVKVYILGE